MKYVIFKHRTLLMPIIIPDCVTHSQVKIGEAIPISAGFFTLNKFGLVEVQANKSESLNLGPKEGDEKLINAVLLEMPTSSSLDYDELDKHN